MTKPRRGTIESDTSIMPDVIAEQVVREAEMLVDAALPEDFAASLTEQAEAVYRTSESFRKRVRARGNKGLDALYVFMRHWVSSLVRGHSDALFKKLPQSFRNGEDPG